MFNFMHVYYTVYGLYIELQIMENGSALIFSVKTFLLTRCMILLNHKLNPIDTLRAT